MRSFATVAILTALVGLFLGAALAAADPNLGQGGGIAIAAGESISDGALGGLLRIVGKPLQGVLNLATGPVIKTGAVNVEPKKKNPDGGDGGKPVSPGSGGGGKR